MGRPIGQGAAAVAALYFINGAVTASVGPRLPEISDNIGVGLAALGLALTGQVIGLIGMMPVSVKLIHRFGARAVGGMAAVLYSAAIAMVGLAPSAAVLFAVLVVVGVANAPLDVAMATLGKGVEEARGRKTLSLFEAAFVAGLVSGSAVGAVAAGRFGVDVHLAAVAAVCVLAAVMAMSFLPAAEREDGSSTGMFRVLRDRPLVRGLALIALAGLWCEAVGLDWAALFSTEALGASPMQQGIPGLWFVASIGVALLVGGLLADRFGAVPVVRCGGALIAVGMAIVGFAPSITWASVGFGLTGLGLANIHPLALSAAGSGPSKGAAFAAVNAISYLGLVGEKPGIGLLAGATSLRIALATTVVVGVFIALSARLVADRPQKDPG